MDLSQLRCFAPSMWSPVEVLCVEAASCRHMFNFSCNFSLNVFLSIVFMLVFVPVSALVYDQVLHVM